jgi:hypothetical protein
MLNATSCEVHMRVAGAYARRAMARVAFETIADPKAEVMRVSTAPDARTALFVPELKTLFVAAPARARRPAAIWPLRTS